MIQDKSPKIDLIEDPEKKEKPKKVRYFDEDISWLWSLQEIIENIKNSER